MDGSASLQMHIHPSAVVHDRAQLGKGVEIGPYCVLGPRVRLGDGCRLHAHVVIEGDTEIGPECHFWPYASLGSMAQDRRLDARNESGKLRVGARNQFREHVTISLGTPSGTGITRIGDDNMFLVGSHVAHDVTLGNHVTMTNSAMAAGHTWIGDRAILGAMIGVHQFCRVGTLAMLGAGAMVSKDAPPFAMVHGDRAKIRGVNVIGMRRAGYSTGDIAIVKRAFRALFWRVNVIADRIDGVHERWGDHPLVAEILNFMAGTQRGVLHARNDSEFEAEPRPGGHGD